MTIKKAIAILSANRIISNGQTEFVEAVDRAIEALETLQKLKKECNTPHAYIDDRLDTENGLYELEADVWGTTGEPLIKY
ncbi:hypothetical protein M2146_002516 [Lachnospiraceae bacterium PF1-22]